MGGLSEGDFFCKHLTWILSPRGHRCSSPHHQCSHLRERAQSPRALGPGGTGLRAGRNWEEPGVYLTTGEVVHTSPQTHMPYFKGPVSRVGLPTFGAKQVAVAGDVAVGVTVMLGHREREHSQLDSFPISSLSPPSITTHPFPAHLSMTPRSQGLPAALAPQTGSVPISAQRHHLLSWWWKEVVALGAGQGDPPALHHLPVL